MKNTTPMMAIEIEAVSKIYTPREGSPGKAIDKLSLSIPPGQVYGILGDSGAGKTVLAEMIGGFEMPTSGTIRLHGQVVALDDKTLREKVGLVLEGTQSIVRPLTIWQNLIHFSQAREWSDEKRNRQATHLLQELDLWMVRDTPVSQLSRGQQRQVAFLCALITDPPIVVLDEPLSGLDAEATQSTKTWLKQLTQTQGKTVVLTTRHPEIAQDLCDRVAIIDTGQLVAEMSLADLANTMKPNCYHIKVNSYLISRWSEWFDNLVMSYTKTGETIFSGPIRDQAALYGLLSKFNNLGVQLLSITPMGPTLQDILHQVKNKIQPKKEFSDDECLPAPQR